ncbi:creatininase family protein [Mycobacterium timonense]|uniref:Uncharacterized protein n=1 Tax=Mycobacterium timonense TaxID=701043 RepID=A0A7I9ZEN5_9MYCO|nr:hypothetical protein MTIM_53490 [Mycobacterium timonense]
MATRYSPTSYNKPTTREPHEGRLYPSRDDWAEARIAAGIQSSNHDDMHAGELETSILLASCPDYLREGWQTSDHTASDRRYLTTLGIHAYTPTGIIGYPSHATETKGNKASTTSAATPPP